MSGQAKNGLVSARSAYLRSAIHQPVQWNEWGPDAFRKAQEQDKPVLLDIGAVWCHWCHVMDRESYEDVETARLINQHFIPVKVDRDERPDVDARYQAAVSAISGQGGWPLTAFLTPEGRPFFGGTYFPPLDQHGRPGLRRVLMTMAEAFQNRRDEVHETAASVMAAIEHNESFDGSAQEPGAELVDKIVSSALNMFDPRFGGFGSQPKFPHSAALDLLLDEAGRNPHNETQDTRDRPDQAPAPAKSAAMLTLEKMSKGGIYDHLAGGFHRYSVDERWVVPHFEKMSYDNSELLKNYVHAFQSFQDQECAQVARETIAWIGAWLSDRQRGGFYASQDADVSLEDDGDYFTWTQAEAAAVLTPDEMEIAGLFYDIGELGDMHHNPAKNVLHREFALDTVAQRAGVTLEEAGARLASARRKLYAARLSRPTPYVDKTVYVAWNAMMISAFLEAGRVLPDAQAAAFALKTLERLLAEAWEEGSGSMGHVVAYGGDAEAGPPVAGMLDDYVFTGHAALDAWETTGDMRFFNAALAIAEAALAKFYDRDKGGFFDTEEPRQGEVRLGALNTRRKPLQDAPTPAGNAVGAALLLRLAELTGRADLRDKAKATLECFAAVVEHFGLYAASYGLALRRMVLPPTRIVIVGSDAAADELARAALRPYAVNKSVIRLPNAHFGNLPPALAQTLPNLPPQPGSFAVVCSGFSCRPPVASAAELNAQQAAPMA